MTGAGAGALPRRLSRAIAAFALAAALAGCNAMPPPNLRSPNVVFSDFGLSDIGFERVKFVLTVEADNPNDVDIPLTNVRFDLALLGQPFAEGAVDRDRITLPRRSTKQIPIEFTVPTSRLLDVARVAKTGDFARLTYRLSGRANWGESSLTIPFERSGDLDIFRKLRELLGLGLSAPHARTS